MRFLAGVLTGSILSLSLAGYVLVSTTVSWRSTLFPAQAVKVTNQPVSKAFKRSIPGSVMPRHIPSLAERVALWGRS